MAIAKRYITTVDRIRIYRVTEPQQMDAIRFMAYQNGKVIADESFARGTCLIKTMQEEFISMALRKKK